MVKKVEQQVINWKKKKKKENNKKAEFPSYTRGEEREVPKQNFLSCWSEINYGITKGITIQSNFTSFRIKLMVTSNTIKASLIQTSYKKDQFKLVTILIIGYFLKGNTVLLFAWLNFSQQNVA